MKFPSHAFLSTLLLITLCLAAHSLFKSGWTHSGSAPAAPNPVLAADFQILYTPSGFVPDYLEVPIGSSVAFVNTATGTPLWLASNPYPGATDYPALNAGRGYAAGEAYAFRFTEGGTFGYHNQDAPIDDAVIVVRDPAHPTPDISKTQARQQAIRDKLVAMLVPGKPDSIFAVIDAIQADSAVSLDCHDIGHDLGHRAYELYVFSSAMTYDNPARRDHASVMDICAGGYVHGILEEASLHDAHFMDHPGDLCANVPASNAASCYHGAGHALMFASGRDIQKSLAGCRMMPNADDDSRCFEGVWMEAFWGNTEHSGPGTLGWDLNKPLDPCISSASDAKHACFIYASFGYLRTHVRDYSGAVRMCSLGGLGDADASYCLRGVGIALVAHLKAQSLEQTESYAANLSDTYKLGFYEGVMGYGRLSGLSENQLASVCGAMKTDSVICGQAIGLSK